MKKIFSLICAALLMISVCDARPRYISSVIRTIPKKPPHKKFKQFSDSAVTSAMVAGAVIVSALARPKHPKIDLDENN